MPKVEDIEVKEGDKPNTYIVTYVPPKKGTYNITVKFGGDDVPKSPFKIGVEPGIDVTQCRAFGPGLDEAIVGEEATFTVECGEGAGMGRIFSSLSQLVFTMSQLVFTMSQLVFTMSQLVLTMSQLVLTMSQLFLTMSQLVLTMSQHVLTMSQLVLTMSQCRFPFFK